MNISSFNKIWLSIFLYISYLSGLSAQENVVFQCKTVIAETGIGKGADNMDSLVKPSVYQIENAVSVLATPARYKDQATQNIKFLDIEQGMNSSYVRAIVEDSRGNMWFGTEGGGVSCYDGKTFVYYTTGNGLSHNRIRKIFEDSRGILWFCTYGGGVCCFDGKEFTHYTEEQGLSSDFIQDGCEDKNGNLWFATHGEGVCKFDRTTFTVYDTSCGMNNGNVWAILEDKTGSMWFATNGGGLIRFDGRNFYQYTLTENSTTNQVLALIEDKTGNIWFGTDGSGVFCFNPSMATTNDLKCKNFTTNHGLVSNRIWALMQDTKDGIWMGTYGGGVARCINFDTDYPVFTSYTSHEGISNDNVWALAEDSYGNIWFGTNGGGASIYGSQEFSHYTVDDGLTDNRIRTIMLDSGGDLWFGTYGGGVCKYNADNEITGGKKFIEFTGLKDLEGKRVMSILEDSKGTIWFGAFEGLFKYSPDKGDIKSKSAVFFNSDNGLNYNRIRAITEDHSGKIWIATYGGGINIYDPKATEKGGEKFSYLTSDQGLPENKVLAIHEDKKGIFWIGTYGGGLCRYDPAAKGDAVQIISIGNGFTSDKVLTIFEDHDENLWVGTEGGGVGVLLGGNTGISFKASSMFANRGLVFLTEKGGLSSDIVFSIVETDDHNIWLGTEKGLTRLCLKVMDKLVSEFKDLFDIDIYGPNEGFKGNDCYTNSVCIDKRGKIWWGTGKHLTMYDPAKDLKETNPPKIRIKGLRLFFEEIEWDSSSNSFSKNVVSNVNYTSPERWENLPIDLELPYNKNHLTFDFVGISWKCPEKVRYRFILEGLDKKWTPLTSNTEATYSSLLPGNYSFKVVAENGDGYASQPATFSFTIHPPWWQTIWFRLGAVLFIVLFLFTAYRLRVAALKKRQRELEQTVVERTAEVVSQKREIEDKNDELNQLVEEVTAQRDEIGYQRDEIESQHSILQKQKEHIEEIHHDVTQSITYAKRIQTSMLPDINMISPHVSDYFVLFRPRDVVSGDFYWVAEVEGYTIITVADCTGHGVPGAFMSMLGISFLRDIVVKEHVMQPEVILIKLRQEIVNALMQSSMVGPDSSRGSEIKDGMDMALISIKHGTHTVQFAGANNPLYIVRQEGGELVLEEIKPDKMPIAIYDRMDKFTLHEFELEKGDCLYMFSDGYADQFGGAKGKKFKYKPFKELLTANSQLPMNEQKELFDNTLREWMSWPYPDRGTENEQVGQIPNDTTTYGQVDDITLLGLRM